MVIGLGVDELSCHSRDSETYALLLLGSLGAIAVAGADDLVSRYPPGRRVGSDSGRGIVLLCAP